MIQILFVELAPLEQLSGILGTITVAVAWFYGILVLMKAIQLKYKILFYFFFAVMFTISPWYPSGIGYVYWLFTREVLTYPVYVLLGTLGAPIALFAWFQIYIPALHPNLKKILLISSGILTIIFYVYLFVVLFFVPGAPIQSLIGIQENAIDIEYKGFALIYLAILLLISTVTGNEFSIHSMKNEDKTIKWKGRFLILSFNFFAIGAIGDGFLPLNPVTLIIFRIIMVLASTFYYIGFIMPKWMKKILKLD